MKTYELIIESLQPPCGGKDPKQVSIQSVTIEDPVEYVEELEHTRDLDISSGPSGETIIRLDRGLKHITYTFTED